MDVTPKARANVTVLVKVESISRMITHAVVSSLHNFFDFEDLP